MNTKNKTKKTHQKNTNNPQILKKKNHTAREIMFTMMLLNIGINAIDTDD